MSVESIGAEMPWDEAIRLAQLLRRDPSSAIATAVEGWDYPLSRLEAMIADLWDLEHAKAGAKKPVTYPRPYKTAEQKVRHGTAAGRSPDQVKEILRAHSGRGEIQAPV